MSSELHLSPLPKGQYGQVSQYEVKAEVIDGDLIVKVCHLGKKHVYRSDEMLFTDDGKILQGIRNFFPKLNCDAAEALSHHIQSIGFTVINKVFTPVLSTQMVVKVQF